MSESDFFLYLCKIFTIFNNINIIMKKKYESPEVRLVICQVENGYALSHRDPATSTPQLEEFHNTEYSYGDDIF